MIYDLGDEVLLSITVTDDTGAASSATMALSVTDPSGTASTPTVTAGSDTGTYSATVTPDSVGTWFYKWTASGTVTAVESGQFTVSDPAPRMYGKLASLKHRMGIDATNTTEDETLISKLISATEDVEADCGGRIFTMDKTATARIFNVHGKTLLTPEGEKLFVDDIATETDLVVEVGNVYTDSWTAITDYITGPENALAKRRPIEWLIRDRFRWAYHPRHRIRITAHWGWPAIPNSIDEATELRAHRLARRPGSPEGVAGYNDLGVVRVGKWDPDYDKLISKYIKFGFGA